MPIAPTRSQPATLKVAVQRAFRDCYEGVGFTQDQLADATGIPQPTISRYARGASVPDVIDVAMVEDACDAKAQTSGGTLQRRPRGWVAAQAGLAIEVTTVPQAIAMDPNLSDIQRKILTGMYEGFDPQQ